MNRRIYQDQEFADLMRHAQAGDRAAYSSLLHAIVPFLRAAIRKNRFYTQPQDADDLVQDILLALHQVRATYDPTRPFLPWLMGIAGNQIADGARRRARRGSHEIITDEFPVTSSGDGTNSHIEDGVDLNSPLIIIHTGQRQAIEMLKLKEMTLKEASVASGKSIAALKVANHRAVQTLRKILRKE